MRQVQQASDSRVASDAAWSQAAAHSGGRVGARTHRPWWWIRSNGNSPAGGHGQGRSSRRRRVGAEARDGATDQRQHLLTCSGSPA